MALRKLANELEETVRQTRQMADEINEALTMLTESHEECEDVRASVATRIIIALQAQDRIEQRCVNILQFVDKMLDRSEQIDEALFADVWTNLTMDELSKPELSGAAARIPHGEVELF